MKKNRIFIKAKGFSLIEVMVSLSIMTVISFGFATFIINLNKEISKLKDKLNISDTKTSLQRFISNGEACNCLFKNTVFDISANPIKVSNLPDRIPLGYNPPPAAPCTPTGDSFVKTGDNIFATNLKLESLDMVNITPISSNNYMAELRLLVENSNIPMAPIKTFVNFSVESTDPDDAKRFESCASTATPSSLDILTSPITILCNTAGSADMCDGGVNFGPVISENTWTTVNLPATVPATAKSVLLKLHGAEVKVWMRSAGSLEPTSVSNRVIYMGNDYSTDLVVPIDLGGDPTKFEIYLKKSDPPTYSFVVVLIGYSE